MNQSDYQKVQTHIIEPMTRLYNPPAHLREDPKAFEMALEEYRRSLRRYSAEVLKRGWDEVKDGHKTWIWPHFQAIRDACERFKPSGEMDGQGYRQRQSQSERHSGEARAAAIRAMDNGAGIIAEREGYWIQLLGYLYNCAIAQIEAGRPVSLAIPDPIPSEWLRIGAYLNARKEERSKKA